MHSTQSSSSAILALFTLLTTQARAAPQYDSGSWSQSSVAVESAPAVTAAPSASVAAPVDWTTAVTWPAGCESWANPCPKGAMTSGVAPTAAVLTWPAGCETWANPCPATAVVSGGSAPA